MKDDSVLGNGGRKMFGGELLMIVIDIWISSYGDGRGFNVLYSLMGGIGRLQIDIES